MGYAEESAGFSGAMQNGSILEKVALPWYEFTNNVSVNLLSVTVLFERGAFL